MDSSDVVNAEQALTDVEQPNSEINATEAQTVVDDSEHMVPQSKVNELVGIAKKKAYEKALREIEAKSTMQEQQSQPSEQEQQSPGFDEKLLEEKAREIAAREFEQMQQKKMREDFHKEFAGRIKEGKTSIDGFDDATKDFNWDKYEPEMFLASQFPDTASIVKVLAQDPDKLDRINSAIARGNQDIAYKLMENLQKSISANKQAVDEQKQNNTPEPLNQLKPSVGAGGDGGDLTLQDMKAMFLG